VLPFDTDDFDKTGIENRMIVISDGDIAINEVRRGEPLDLDKDKWTSQHYGNGQFLLNSVHYLLDDNGLLNLRSKTLQIQFLDKEKAYRQRIFWQLLNLGLPLLLLFAFGIAFNYIRKRRYN
jgi:gliding-associated putative ABC transporter substrate-binding component GldG